MKTLLITIPIMIVMGLVISYDKLEETFKTEKHWETKLMVQNALKRSHQTTGTVFTTHKEYWEEKNKIEEKNAGRISEIKTATVKLSELIKKPKRVDKKISTKKDDRIEKILKKNGYNGNMTIEQASLTIKNKNINYSQKYRLKETNQTLYLDCSSYASLVLNMAGTKIPVTTTAEIFKNHQKISVNRINNLAPKTLIGWPEEKNRNQSGHVYVKIDNNTFTHCTSYGQPVQIISKEQFEKEVEGKTLYYKHYS